MVRRHTQVAKTTKGEDSVVGLTPGNGGRKGETSQEMGCVRPPERRQGGGEKRGCVKKMKYMRIKKKSLPRDMGWDQEA